MRLGLIGGTFDPIHNGHLRAAEELWEDFGLDQVMIIPAFIPPHKEDHPISPFERRYEMCRLAVNDNPKIIISDLEATRGGKSYSIDTITELRQRRPDDRLFFILGKDAFLDIPTWQDFKNLFTLTDFIVIARPGYPRDQVEETLALVSPDFRPDPRGGRYLHPTNRVVHFWETTLLDISSTRLRQYIREGKSIKYLVPPKVEDYIYAAGLYQ